MFDLDTSIRIVWHVLVVVFVEYFFHIGGISIMLPPWSCQCSWDFSSRDLIPVYVRHFQPLWRSWSVIYLQPLWRSWSIIYIQLSWRSWSFVYLHHGDSNLSILYVAMTTHVIFCIMHICVHCTLMYPGLLYVLTVIGRDICNVFLDGWFFHLFFHHSTSGMDL